MTDTRSAARRPAPITLMTVACGLSIVLGLAAVGLSIYCAAVLSGTGAGADFAAGYVQQAGFDPATFGAEQAGALSALAVLNALCAAVVLLGVRKRRVTMVRIAAGLWVLTSINAVALIGAAMALTVLGASFLPAVHRWFEGAEPSLGSLDSQG